MSQPWDGDEVVENPWDSDEAVAPVAAPGALRSAALGVSQGGTGGYVDELAALYQNLKQKALGRGVKLGTAASPELRAEVEARPSLGDILKKKMRDERALAQEAHPIAYGLGEAGGAIGASVVGGAGMKAAGVAIPRAASAAGRIATATGMGFGTGALYGAGTSEADSVVGVAKDALKGGLVGGVTGGLFSGVGEGIAGVRGYAQRGSAKALADQTAASTKKVSEAIKSATSKYRSSVQSASRDLEVLERAAAGSDDIAEQARQFLATEEGTALRTQVAKNKLITAPERIDEMNALREEAGNLVSNKEQAIQQAVEQGLSPEAAKRAITSRIPRLLPRLAPVAMAAVGSAFGPMGAAAGGIAGGVMSLTQGYWGRTLQNAMRDPALRKNVFDKVVSTLGSDPSKLGRWAQPLLQAAGHGGQRLAAAHYVLAQRDPDYAKHIAALTDDGPTASSEPQQ